MQAICSRQMPMDSWRLLPNNQINVMKLEMFELEIDKMLNEL